LKSSKKYKQRSREARDTYPRKNGDMRWLNIIFAAVAVVSLIAITVLAAIYFPQAAVYVPIIALGLALALQKYTASFIAYFVITFSKIYDLGDRIRIANFKGDVRRIGVLHTTLEEVGEDEKLGGELTGRLLHFPNQILLDQPVLNYSKDYSIHYTTISSDYMFDEVRIPLTPGSNIQKAIQVLEEALSKKDDVYIQEAKRIFEDGYPRFLNEALNGPRVQVYIEPGHVWIQGKFVAPLKGRNDLRSEIFKQFIEKIKGDKDISIC
jgi:small-conductance mechanosensitive channel